MKILFISNMYPGKNSPAYGTFVKSNEKHLIQMGFEIEKVVIDRKLDSRFVKFFYYFIFVKKGLVALIKKKYDFVYCHYLTYSTIPILIYMLTSIKNFKLFINIHGDDLTGSTLIHRIVGLANKYLLKHCTGIIVPSHYFKEIVLDKDNSIRPEKIHVSFSGGVDLGVFKPNVEVGKKRDFCWVGRIEEGKGWLDVVKAAWELKERGEEGFKINIFGDGRELSMLLREIEAYEVEHLFQYHGTVSHEELSRVYNQSRFLIFSTYRESLGLVLLEALASGTPCIVSNIKPLCQIGSRNNCIFYEVANYKDLGNRIYEALHMDESRYNKMATNAVVSIESYSSKKCMVGLERFIRKFMI